MKGAQAGYRCGISSLACRLMTPQSQGWVQALRSGVVCIISDQAKAAWRHEVEWMHVPSRSPVASASSLISVFNTASRASNHSATMLPDEIIAQLTSEFQCREQQIQQLAALYTVRDLGLYATTH